MIHAVIPIDHPDPQRKLKEKKNHKPAPVLGVYCSIVLPVCLIGWLVGWLFVSIVHKFALIAKSLVALVDVVENGGA